MDADSSQAAQMPPLSARVASRPGFPLTRLRSRASAWSGTRVCRGIHPPRDGRAYPDGVAQTAPVETERPVGEEDVVPDVPWIVIVWNDPINLMSYVVYVFQKLFGYPREKATKLMLDVHHKGKAVVAEGPRERCEFDVSRLHAHGLWATMQKDD